MFRIILIFAIYGANGLPAIDVEYWESKALLQTGRSKEGCEKVKKEIDKAFESWNNENQKATAICVPS